MKDIKRPRGEKILLKKIEPRRQPFLPAEKKRKKEKIEN